MVNRMPTTDQVKLSPEELEELSGAFDLFDKDGDGTIAATELHVVLQAIGRNLTIDEVHKSIIKIKKE